MADTTTEPGASITARPNVLAFPSPTTFRYLIFLVALVCSGLFVGNWVHGQVQGDEWLRTVLDCVGAEGLDAADVEAFALQEGARNECMAGVERVRAGFMFGGVGVTLLAATAVLLITPNLIERRRRLRPFGPELAGADERFAKLAANAGVSRAVHPVVGAASQRDAFSYGLPGRYRVALPPAAAIRWRDQATFDPLVGHELAHVRHHDVALAWLVRSTWYVLVPVLSLPIIVSIFSEDRGILLDYSWRVSLLAGVVLLLSNRLLRSREYDADLRACHLTSGPEPVAQLLMRVRPTKQSLLARTLARHPSPAERVAVVRSPTRVTAVTGVDGFVSAFLGALAVPLLVRSFHTILKTVGLSSGEWLISVAAVGPILGAAVGLGLWRAAVIGRLTGERLAVLPVAAGVALGFAIGESASLAQTGTGNLTGLDHPWWVLVTGLVAAGATVLSGSLAELWADLAPRFSRSLWAWLFGLTVNAVLFSGLLWSSLQFQLALDQGGWVIARAGLVTTLSEAPILAVVLVLAASAAIPLLAPARQAWAPGWLIEVGQPGPWPVAARSIRGMVVVAGVGAGLIGGASIVGYRVVAGASDVDEELLNRLHSYFWVAGLAGAAAMLAMGLLVPRRGLSAGLVAGPIAVLTTTAVFLALNSALGGSLDLQLVTGFAQPALVIGFYLSLPAAAIGLMARQVLARRLHVRPARLYAGLAVSVAAALVLTPLAVAARDWFVSTTDQVRIVPSSTTADAALVLEVQRYSNDVATPVIDGYVAIIDALATVESTPDVAQKRSLLQSEVIAPLSRLLDDAQAYRPASEEVAEAHDKLVAGLQDFVTAARQYDEALVLQDPDLTTYAVSIFQQADAELVEWLVLLEQLLAEGVDE